MATMADVSGLSGGKHTMAQSVSAYQPYPTTEYTLATIIPVVVASLLGIVFTLVRTMTYGVGTSSDSAVYIFAAKSLLSAHSYRTYDGSPLTDFPPLFPAMLASMMSFGMRGVDAARWLNACCFGAIILLAGIWLATHVERPFFRNAGLIAVVAAIPVRIVASYAWSEPLFILLTLVFLLSVERFLRSGAQPWLYGAGIAAALACMTRYIGLAVVAAGLFLLLAQWERPGRKARNVLAFGATAVLPLGAWLARNYLLSSTLTGYRPASPFTPSDNLRAAADLVTWNLLPIPIAPRALLGGMLMALVLGLSLVRLRQEDAAESGAVRTTVLPLASLIVAYLGCLIATSSIAAFDRIDLRLVSPAHMLLLLLVISLLDRASYARITHLRQWLVAGSLMVGLAVALFLSLAFDARDLSSAIRGGAGGHASAQWAGSPTVAYLRAHPIAGTLYSNDPHGILLLADQRALESPRKYPYNAPGDTAGDNSAAFVRSVESSQGIYLVWVDNAYTRFFAYLYTPHELARVVDLEAVATTPDGAIYHVTAKHG